MKTYKKEFVVYDFEDTFDGFCVEVHYDEDATRFYLYHKMQPHVIVFMFGVAPTKDECVVRDYIASNIEEHIEEYLGSIITYEDIA